MFKSFFTSLLLAFLLSKLTAVAQKFSTGISDKDLGSQYLKPFEGIFSTLHINDIKAFEVFNLGTGFEGTSHTLNYLITYIPIFMIPFILFSILSAPRKQPSRRIKNSTNDPFDDPFFTNQFNQPKNKEASSFLNNISENIFFVLNSTNKALKEIFSLFFEIVAISYKKKRSKIIDKLKAVKEEDSEYISFHLEGFHIQFHKSYIEDMDLRYKKIYFGKYKGQKWLNLPTVYLVWCINNIEGSNKIFACNVLYRRYKNKI